MPKVQMDIPEKLIKEAADGKIRELQKKLENAERREGKLKLKIHGQESDVAVARKVVSGMYSIIDDVRWEPQFEDIFRGWD